MPFVHLPAELLHNIVSRSTIEDVKRLRLVCTRISEVADEYLLPVLELYYAFESLDFAQLIASRPGIAKSVRLICFHADRLNGQSGHRGNDPPEDGRCGTLSFERWAENHKPHTWIINRWSGWSATYPDCPLRIISQTTSHDLYRSIVAKSRKSVHQALLSSDLSEDAAYANYLRVRREQDLLDNGATIESSFEALLSACHNLESVWVSSEDSLAPTTTWRLSSFRNALAIPLGDPEVHRSGVLALVSILRAAEAVQKPIKCLGAGNLAHGFFNQDKKTMDMLIKSFSHVESFTFQLQSPFEWNLRNEDERKMFDFLKGVGKDQVPAFLSVAQKLRDLNVILTGRNEQGRLPLRSIMGNNHWPYLRKLRLDWFTTGEQDLVCFLLMHRATLEHVHLADFGVTDGCLSQVFRQLGGQLPVLRRVLLRGVLSDSGEMCRRCKWALYGAQDVGRCASVRTMIRLEQYLIYGKGDVPIQDFNIRDELGQVDDEIEPYLMHWVPSG